MRLEIGRLGGEVTFFYGLEIWMSGADGNWSKLIMVGWLEV